MKQQWIEELKQILPKEQILPEEAMKQHTTFRIGGPAECLVLPNREQLAKVLLFAKDRQIPITVIGNGSNLLVADEGISGIVIEIGKFCAGIEIEGNKLRIGAGTLLSKAAQTAASESLAGFEFVAGIPGSVGGAVVMNAGAYGGELKDILEEVTVLTPEGEFLVCKAEELELSYRHSCIPERGWIVVEAVVALHPGKEEEIRAVMADLKNQRVSKQPLEFPSAGSTFKRPQGYFAGKLIEDCGCKGYRVGDAQVSEKHSGFVINLGNATAADVLQLICDVQKKVEEQFAVHMEPEVRMLGFSDKT